MIPLIVGTGLAIAALAFVLYPIFVGGHAPRAPQARQQTSMPAENAGSEATIDAEIEAAVHAYRYLHDRCASCGTPVVARDARYCVNCGNRLAV